MIRITAIATTITTGPPRGGGRVRAAHLRAAFAVGRHCAAR